MFRRDAVDSWTTMPPTAQAKTKEDVIVDANLKLIDDLAAHLSNSGDKILIDKIMNAVQEIVAIQRGVIRGLESKVNQGISGNAAPAGGKTIDFANIPWDEEEDEEWENVDRDPSHGYMPVSANGFETDDQVKRAFSNYLQYHYVSKGGKIQGLERCTVNDYVSRAKVLWDKFFKEWDDGELDGKLRASADVLPKKVFLNIYRNVDVLQEYIEFKKQEIENRAEPFDQDELKANPLKNSKNLANSMAALKKFESFKLAVEKR